jgi:CheY-like chemotaxis protein
MVKSTDVAKLTCFLVDDDIDDIEIFALAMEDLGGDFTCVTAADGIDAIQKLQGDESFTPDFIFLDLNMPRMNGKQCLAEIKKIERLMSTPVIIYSTSSNSKDVDETLRMGATHFLTKPSSISTLTQELASLLQAPANNC